MDLSWGQSTKDALEIHKIARELKTFEITPLSTTIGNQGVFEETDDPGPNQGKVMKKWN